jgi:hypothetical protein
VVIVVRDGHVVLEQPDDMTAFKVVIHGGDPTALAGVGRMAGRDNAWIHFDAVRRLASGNGSATWEQDFSGMIDFARKRGWIDDERQEIQAHVEWES